MKSMRALPLVAVILAAAMARPAAATETEPEGKTETETETAPAAAETADTKALRKLTKAPSGYVRLLGGIAFGDGVRFNNPYRLRTQLGESAESLSLTSGYIDFGVGVALGPPDGFQHGGAIHLSLALSGVPQQVLAPSYLLVYRGAHRFMGFGRLGIAYVVSPDENVGGELALGGAFFVTSGIGVSAELVGDLFYGAGTYQVATAVYPIVSGQLGIIVDYEVLP
jgi:hypothetical protein